MIADLPLVCFVIINLTRLTSGVCMKVRFKSKVARGFSFSPLRDSRSPLPGSLIGKKRKTSGTRVHPGKPREINVVKWPYPRHIYDNKEKWKTKIFTFKHPVSLLGCGFEGFLKKKTKKKQNSTLIKSQVNVSLMGHTDTLSKMDVG